MYRLYLGGELFPTTPAKITQKVKNQNKTYNLINGIETSIIKDSGLSEIDFEITLPSQASSDYQGALYYLDLLRRFKTEKLPIQFKLIRQLPNEKKLFSTAMNVTLEEYTVKEEQQQGFASIVSISLKQYNGLLRTKQDMIKNASQIFLKTIRSTDTPQIQKTSKKTSKTYTTQEGETFLSISKAVYGTTEKVKELKEKNSKVVKTSGGRLKAGTQIELIKYELN